MGVVVCVCVCRGGEEWVTCVRECCEMAAPSASKYQGRYCKQRQMLQ